jgi:hypothetical protein
MPLSGTALIIGKIDVNVNATDDDSGIDHVEFYVNNEIQANDTTGPYSWLWSQWVFGKRTLTVKAFDKEGNSASQDIEVWKFF